MASTQDIGLHRDDVAHALAVGVQGIHVLSAEPRLQHVAAEDHRVGQHPHSLCRSLATRLLELEAMVRLLAGLPLHSDGKLTVKSLAVEAGLRRNKLTHKHTELKDLFYALVRAQHERPRIADDLHAANAELTEKVGKLTDERHRLRGELQALARVVPVLEVETTGCARRWRSPKVSLI